MEQLELELYRAPSLHDCMAVADERECLQTAADWCVSERIGYEILGELAIESLMGL